MTGILWAGTVAGVLFGLAHAVYVYRLIAAGTAESVAPSRGRAAYYALWTFGLWVLFGSYVLVLWLIGAVLYAVFKAFR